MVTASTATITARDASGPISYQGAMSILADAKNRTAARPKCRKRNCLNMRGEQEVERTQAHDGEDVGGIGDEGVAG